MNEDGYKPLLAFYNQTYHGMTMAAGLRSAGSAFRIDERLANNMLVNVERVIVALQSNPDERQFSPAWGQARDWLKASSRTDAGSDYYFDLYELNALAYTTWAKLCEHPRAKHYAEENYTVIAHPDTHPGVKAIKQIWVNPSIRSTPTTRATLANLASLIDGQK